MTKKAIGFPTGSGRCQRSENFTENFFPIQHPSACTNAPTVWPRSKRRDGIASNATGKKESKDKNKIKSQKTALKLAQQRQIENPSTTPNPKGIPDALRRRTPHNAAEKDSEIMKSKGRRRQAGAGANLQNPGIPESRSLSWWPRTKTAIDSPRRA